MTGIEVGVAVIIGVLLGRFLPNRRKGPKPPPEPVCGCGHHHSYHDPATGECHGQTKGDPIKFDIGGYATAYKQVQCSCKQYSGAVPLPEFYAPEVTSGGAS